MSDSWDELMDRIHGRSSREPEYLDPELEDAKVVRDGVCYLEHAAVCEEYRAKRHHGYNASLAEWKERSEATLNSQDWEGYLHCHAKPFWPVALTTLKNHMGLPAWSDLARFAWIHSDELWTVQAKWRALFTQRADFPNFMNADEVARLAALPEVIEVYRGCRDATIGGLSWTTDFDSVEHFEYEVKPRSLAVIVEGRVNKTDVFAFVDKDEEFEIITFPEHVFDQKILKRAGRWLDV